MVEREREEERARESERELERERERERGRYCLEAEVKQNRRHSETKAGLDRTRGYFNGNHYSMDTTLAAISSN